MKQRGKSSDQIGHFPLKSIQSNVYVVVFYYYAGNHTKSILIKNRTKMDVLLAYQIAYKWYWAKGYKPLVHKLDNKTSELMQNCIAGQQARIKYTPPDNHLAKLSGKLHPNVAKSLSSRPCRSIPKNFHGTMVQNQWAMWPRPQYDEVMVSESSTLSPFEGHGRDVFIWCNDNGTNCNTPYIWSQSVRRHGISMPWKDCILLQHSNTTAI